VSPTGKVFAVGEGHVIYHYDGNTWSQQTVANLEGDLMDVWGASDDDVYPVGTNGLILRHAPIGGQFEPGRSSLGSAIRTVSVLGA
jgi:hypothetical protein